MTEKTKQEVLANKSKGQANSQIKTIKLNDSDLDKVSGGVLGAPIRKIG
ncbi:hypothetical protein CCP2SC5_220021 [Azospirillaceae bacterium]